MNAEEKAIELVNKFKDVIPFKGFMFPNEISKYVKQCVLIAEAYHKAKVEAISDEEISNYIEDYIKKYGYKMHDLQRENDCITYGQVMNILEWFKEQLLKQ